MDGKMSGESGETSGGTELPEESECP